MPDPTSHQRRNNVLAVAAAVVLVALAVVAAVWLTSRTGNDDEAGDGGVVAVPSESPTGSATLAPGPPADLLPEPMSGQEAIDALGEHLDHVAELNGMTPDQLRDLLLRDPTVTVAPSGRLLYEDEMTPPPTTE